MAKFLNALLFFCYASTQYSVNSEPDSKASVKGLSSEFSSQLRFVTLNADEAFHKYTQIKLKDGENKQAFGRPPSDYFSRIRENYGNFQRRPGSLNIKDALSVPSILFGSSKYKEQTQSSVPIHLKIRSKFSSGTDTQVSDAAEEFSDKLKKIRATESALINEIKMSNGEIKIDSTFTFPEISEELREPQTVWMRFGDAENHTGKLDPSTIKADNKLVVLFIDTYKKFLLNSYKDSKNVESQGDTNSEARGRILGELLYSESAFDKLAKSVIRNTKWILDADISPSVGEKLAEISDLFYDVRLRAADELGNRKRLLEENSDAKIKAIRKGKFDRSVKEPRGSGEALHFSGGNEKKVSQLLSTEKDHIETTPAKETILSAYTDNGILITLRIGSEVGDPYKYLHDILTSNNVTLYVHMKPQISSEPLQSDFVNGLPSSVLYVNLADVNQRNSILKTLKKFKTDPN